MVIMVCGLFLVMPMTAFAAQPTVVSVSPSGSGAPLNGTLIITFSEPMNTGWGSLMFTPNTGTSQNASTLAWSNGDTVYSIDYTVPDYGTTYTVNLSGFRNTMNEVMVPDSTHTFTTLAATAPTITSANSTSVVSGTGGTFQVTATGTTPITYGLTGAPTGVTIDSAGLITIAGTTAIGSHTFTITASNGTLPDDTQLFTLAVTAAPVAPAITSANNTSVVSGTGGTFQVTATGDATITYSLTGEPAGVSINSATGLVTIAGTTAVGSHTFTITASNGISPNATQSFTLTVTAAPVAPAITSANNTSVVSGTGGTFQVTATGDATITYSLSGEPAGVSINSTSGLITIAGTVATGSHTFAITAANGTLPNDTQSFTLMVTSTATAPGINGPASMTLTAGYAATSTGVYTTSGSPSPTVTKTSGNAAITWNSATQRLSIAAGLAAGTYPVVLTAANGTLPDATITFTLTVQAPSGGSSSGGGGSYYPQKYIITSGGNGTWGTDSSYGKQITSNGDLVNFYGIKVDGSWVDGANFTSVSGSTIVTLRPSYLRTLSLGTHTVEFLYNDGYASTTLRIVSGSPQTGDDSNPAGWALTMILSALGACGLTFWRRKQFTKAAEYR